MRKSLTALAASAALILAVIIFHTALLGLLTGALHAGVELQRSFNRDLAHHMREADGGSLSGLALALGLSFTYGVVHALGPGHGKFVVTTYFLAHQRQVWRGLLMGTQIAVLHVISAILIVLATHYLALHFWGRSEDMPGLRAASYGSIALVGVYMMWRALSGRHHAHDHEHGAGCAHVHGDADADAGRQGLLSLGVGIAPCSGAVLLLIFAFANDLVPLGILMTVAIAAGMALTMAALGLASIKARAFVMRRLEKDETANDKPSRLGRIVEIAGAAAIILFGVGMTAVSLMT